MAIPSFKDPAGPPRPPASEWETAPDLLLRARTHEALAAGLADKAAQLDPSQLDPERMRPALQLLWRMARAHRIRALLLRGRAACGDGAPFPPLA